MSNPRRFYLPLEILDCIVDLLHDKPETLKQCCLVSKSWVPRTRKHLFACIKFSTERDLEAWKKTFPDPASSPAYHTRTLSIRCIHVVTAADAEEGGWIQAFSHVVQLEVWGGYSNPDGSEVSLVPFHNFSPALKSLRVVSIATSHSQMFNLVCSLPLLEDLYVMDYRRDRKDRDGTVFQPSNSPALIGTLGLYLTQGMEHVTRRLLGLPNGLRFRKLVWTLFREEDIPRTVALVVGCHDTLEYVDINCCLRSMFL